MLDEHVVEHFAAKAAVRAGAQHLELGLCERNGRSSALGGTHVVKNDVLRVFVILWELRRLRQAVSQRGSSRLVHEAKNVNTSNFTCIQNRPPLSVCPKGRDGNDAIG
mmetsp:Transcript_18545/g.40268  ORF Transcript_18545/g.40268 Transcript_18545/m.40268 type:complete len:108 (-) Transcript_18545:341-664(-)